MHVRRAIDQVEGSRDEQGVFEGPFARSNVRKRNIKKESMYRVLEVTFFKFGWDLTGGREYFILILVIALPSEWSHEVFFPLDGDFPVLFAFL